MSGSSRAGAEREPGGSRPARCRPHLSADEWDERATATRTDPAIADLDGRNASRTYVPLWMGMASQHDDGGGDTHKDGLFFSARLAGTAAAVADGGLLIPGSPRFRLSTVHKRARM